MLVLKEWMPLVRDAIQIAFFIVVGVITILTYQRAKKTLLQPFRTEIFKEQVKVFSTLLSIFAGKTEIELREDFAFDKLVEANTIYLLDCYAALFFELDLDEDKRPYSVKFCPSSLLRPSRLEKDDSHVYPDPVESSKPTEETKAAIWARFEFDEIKIPSEFSAKERELTIMIGSPLVPKHLSTLLQQYLELVRKNVTNLGRTLTSCGKELPEKYPNLEVMKKASTMWIQNKYNDRFKNLEQKATEITEYVRSYFMVEDLLK